MSRTGAKIARIARWGAVSHFGGFFALLLLASVGPRTSARADDAQVFSFEPTTNSAQVSRHGNRRFRTDAAEQLTNDDRSGDASAKTAALQAHHQAAAIDSLPQFYLRARGRTETDHLIKHPAEDPFKNVPGVPSPLEYLIRALDPHVAEEDWYQYEVIFAWDEECFVIGNPTTTLSAPDQPTSQLTAGDPGLRIVHWGTRDFGGTRNVGRNHAVTHGLRADAAAAWEIVTLTNPNYILATRHEFWWGDNGHHNHFSNGGVPPAISTYRDLGVQAFDGETCDVVESRTRFERLWISRRTGLLRGYVNLYAGGETNFYKSNSVEQIAGRTFVTLRDYIDWYRSVEAELSDESKWALHAAWSSSLDWGLAQPGMMVRFRDFREIAPGVWWPFREDRAQGHMTDKGLKCTLTNFSVHLIRTDFELSSTLTAILPNEGERVIDHRYAAPVEYEFQADRTEAEIRQLVDKARKHEN